MGRKRRCLTGCPKGPTSGVAACAARCWVKRHVEQALASAQRLLAADAGARHRVLLGGRSGRGPGWAAARGAVSVNLGDADGAQPLARARACTCAAPSATAARPRRSRRCCCKPRSTAALGFAMEAFPRVAEQAIEGRAARPRRRAHEPGRSRSASSGWARWAHR